MTDRHVPVGFQDVNCCLVFDDVEVALHHYAELFHAVEAERMNGNEGIEYAEIMLGSTRVLLCKQDAAMGSETPELLGGTSANLYIYVADAKMSFMRAMRCGATQVKDVSVMPWGDKCGIIKDMFGYCWIIAQAGDHNG